MVIEGTNEAKLIMVKNWLVGKIVSNDLNAKLKKKNKARNIMVSENLDSPGNFRLQMDLYINKKIAVHKYKDIIVNKFKRLNKTGLTHAFIDQYDNCSHDEVNPQPCKPDRRMEWSD